tara:strand:- start:9665 stop:10465 length:801 start_codon:yes stop_codon:yes gene_type:complete
MAGLMAEYIKRKNNYIKKKKKKNNYATKYKNNRIDEDNIIRVGGKPVTTEKEIKADALTLAEELKKDEEWSSKLLGENELDTTDEGQDLGAMVYKALTQKDPTKSRTQTLTEEKEEWTENNPNFIKETGQTWKEDWATPENQGEVNVLDLVSKIKKDITPNYEGEEIENIQAGTEGQVDFLTDIEATIANMSEEDKLKNIPKLRKLLQRGQGGEEIDENALRSATTDLGQIYRKLFLDEENKIKKERDARLKKEKWIEKQKRLGRI